MGSKGVRRVEEARGGVNIFLSSFKNLRLKPLPLRGKRLNRKFLRELLRELLDRESLKFIE